ncbi:hypothetical protein [Arenibaculum pallidiluteum]|uniref:hypothetical protein n=1 Tax=Arenibaculum pallidiluteum TaxID=2812559 RepID=UPI001A9699B3|nr:hypothetical protein [Arenibaculum pallidiluteum]
MSGIGGIPVGITALATAARSQAPTAKAGRAAGAEPAAAQAAPDGATRPAGTGAIQLDLPKEGRTAESVGAALRSRIEGVLGVLYKDPDALRPVVDRAMEALGENVRKAAEAGVDSVQLRIGSLRTEFGAAAAFDQMVVEVGLVRGGRVSAEDTSVLGFDGGRIELAAEDTARGLAAGRYARTSPLPAAPAESDEVKTLRAVLDRLRAGQEAVAASWRGDDAGRAFPDPFAGAGTVRRY